MYAWKAQGASFHCDVQFQYPCTLIPPVILMLCRRCDENRTPSLLHSIMAVDEFLDILKLSWRVLKVVHFIESIFDFLLNSVFCFFYI